MKRVIKFTNNQRRNLEQIWIIYDYKVHRILQAEFAH